MEFSKAELATFQIERAISLFVNEKDYICSLTLAAAAEEMLGNILHKNGDDNVLSEFLPWYKENYCPDANFRKFAQRVNFTRDELKHGHKNPDISYKVEVSEQLAAQMIMRALINYTSAGIKPSEEMWGFYYWIKDRGDDFLSD